jgi:uncharacterized membrane protein YeaQ/YmgE (transglycosylase-associated protein family)
MAWFGIGLAVAVVVLTIVRSHIGRAFWAYIILGIVGGVGGGTAGNVLGLRGVDDINPWNQLTALVGSLVFLIAFHQYRKWTLRNPPGGAIEPTFETY